MVLGDMFILELKRGRSPFLYLEPEFGFSVLGCWKWVKLLGERLNAFIFEAIYFRFIEFNGVFEFVGQFVIGVNGLNGAFRHTSGTVDTFFRVDDNLLFQFIKGIHRTNCYAIREFTVNTIFSHYMGHVPTSDA